MTKQTDILSATSNGGANPPLDTIRQLNSGAARQHSVERIYLCQGETILDLSQIAGIIPIPPCQYSL